jgi:hypothetical protein
MQSTSTAAQERLHYGVYAGLSMVVLVLTAVPWSSGRPYFQKFFGALNPLAVVVFVLVLGAVALRLLDSRAGLAIFRKDNLKGLLRASGLSLPFAAAMILVDRLSPLGADLNVRFPESLTFYPAMGMVATILFQLVPLCVLTLALGGTAGPLSSGLILRVSIAAASLVEPIYQAGFMIGHSPAWEVALVGVHVYLINVVQLSLFKRYDFASMYAFRLSYYLLWHVLWGCLRLTVLL